ncbi:hypothetical protein M3Y99_00144000 [Aphelenchoides fujianensis]|nr:hypothetical protein M3Y99_00144000 [Aphelenchoides fujianensis]
MSDQAATSLVYQRPSRTNQPKGTPKDDEPDELLLQQKWSVYNEFCSKGEPVMRFSPDGRLAYLLFENAMQLHVVDLIRNCQMHRVQKPLDVFDFVVVSPTAIVVLETYALWLFRLDVENGTFEAIELERQPDYSVNYIVTEIRGTHVAFRSTVLQQYYSYPSEHRFVRLNVDEARLTVDAVEPLTVDLDLHLTADGRWLYGLPIQPKNPDSLHVFDMERRTWSTKKLTGEIGRLDGGLFAWAEDRVFFYCCQVMDNEWRYFLFELDLRQLAWTKLPIVVDKFCRISAIVDEESGEAAGLLVLDKDKSTDQTDVYRLLFRTPDSLVRLAVDALRHHNLDVVGKEEFHNVMNGPCKNVFPLLYAGMTPIPRRLQ